MMIEVRYVGSKGRELLEARAFNQGYDLNAADTPDHIFERFNQAYIAAGSPNGALNAGATARARGVGKAFGFPNNSLGGMLDYNLAQRGRSGDRFRSAHARAGLQRSRGGRSGEHRTVDL